MRGAATVVLGIILFAATDGPCQDVPEQIVMSRGFAVGMALRKNIDLKIEASYTSLGELDLARSRGIYDTLVSASVRGGESTLSGASSSRSSDSNLSLGVSRLLSTGGTLAITTRTGGATNEAESVATPAADWQSSVSVTVSQPLLKNAGTEATEVNVTLAAGALQDAVDRFRLLAIDTVSAVVTSYNHLYVLRQVLDSRVAALRSAQSFLDDIKARERGPLQQLEIANAEFAITQRRKDLVEAERNVSDHEANFRYLIGMETKTRIIPAEPPSRAEPPGTQEQAVQAALAFRPDLRQLRRALKTSQLLERIARHQSLPDLLVSVNGGLTGSGGALDSSYQQVGEDPGTFWSAGLELTVPVGNTFGKYDHRRRAIQTRQVQDQIRALSWLIRNDVETDLRALISARLQMLTADTSVRFAERRLEEYRKSNRAGTATVQEVINADNDLTAARNAQLVALETFASGVTRLWRDTGELLDRQDVSIDTSRPGAVVGGEEDPAGTPEP